MVIVFIINIYQSFVMLNYTTCLLLSVEGMIEDNLIISQRARKVSKIRGSAPCVYVRPTEGRSYIFPTENGVGFLRR